MEAATRQRWGLDDELGDDGSFERQESAFRDSVTADGSSGYPPEPGRYHLYVSYACPWAHRSIIARRLLGMEEAIGLSVANPIRDERGWRFTGGEYTDRANGFEFLAEAYERTDPSFDDRPSTPVLWDTETQRIVNNESGEILRMFSTGLAGLGNRALDLYPEAHRAEIDALNERIYDCLNNAVYKAGFTTDQESYEEEVGRIFSLLPQLDQRLGSTRFLFGDDLVETDLRLFTTLVRFDAVYYVHFKCSRRRLVDYPNLWAYARDVYQRPGVRDTVRFDEIRRHYYCTHQMINPAELVAVMPAADWDEPARRG
jgi:putative glutathione S-transferase